MESAKIVDSAQDSGLHARGQAGRETSPFAYPRGLMNEIYGIEVARNEGPGETVVRFGPSRLQGSEHKEIIS